MSTKTATREKATSSVNSPSPDEIVEPIPQIVPIPSANILEAIGILTEVGKVPIIDDEHIVKSANQPLKDDFRKGQLVRYSYVEKGGMRKDIVVLECGIDKPKVEDLRRNESPVSDYQSAKHWMGLVRNVRTTNGLTFVEVHFENGTTEVIKLTEKIWESAHCPMAADKIIVSYETEPSDDDEKGEQVSTIYDFLPSIAFEEHE